MISFELTEEQSLVRSMLEQLARDSIRPGAKAHDDGEAIAHDMLRIMHEAQVVQALLEDEADDTHLRNCLLLEELGWADTSVAALVGATLGYTHAVMKYGDPTQKAALRDTFCGDRFRGGAVLLQEPGLGNEIKAMQTHAERSGDGWTLSGSKAYVPMTDGCDALMVVARLNDGYGAFLLSKSMDGVSIQAGPKMLGLRGLDMGLVHLDGVMLPAEARLGGDELDVQNLVSAARLAGCAILTGLSRAVFDHITPYTKERVVHGTPLAQKQSVAFRLADMAINIPAMRWMTWRGAVTLDRGRCAAREGRLARIYCGPKATAMADEGIQLMGGHGYMRENPVERWFRDARTLSLLDGIVGI